MAVKLYDPKTKAFRALGTSDSTDLPLSEVLLFNVLIELQCISMYLHAGSPNHPAEDPAQMRASIVSEI